jgi:hypothetical protein
MKATIASDKTVQLARRHNAGSNDGITRYLAAYLLALGSGEPKRLAWSAIVPVYRRKARSLLG